MLKRLAAWVLPHAVYQRIQEQKNKALQHRQHALRERCLSLASSNTAVRDRHKGERCFILANGPSVKNQDLLPLRNELVISVASGYLHPRYEDFRPRYHCVPPVTYALLGKSGVADWFREMDAHLEGAELFLATDEEALVREYDLFSGRTVRYVCFDGTFDDQPRGAVPDISKGVPGVQSVPVMCLMIAMYMGCRDIVLLGTDHDQFKTGRYEYFYESRRQDTTVSQAGHVLSNRHDEFAALSALWKQYRAIREIADSNGVKILNATHGGELDEFPRAKLESLFAR